MFVVSAAQGYPVLQQRELTETVAKPGNKAGKSEPSL